jgi:peptide/nickel transport system substrate-binding protein
VVRLAINTERPPLDRKDVRQALAYALDRGQLAQTVTHGPAVVGSAGLIPPETPWFNAALPDYPFDPVRARALLGGQTFTLELLADASYREPDLLVPMLQSVGITLNVKRVDAKTRAQLLREKNFALAEVQHLGVGGDPDFLRRWTIDQESNDFAQGWTFKNQQFEQLAGEQAIARDPSVRRQLVARMQSILADELPTLALFYRRFYWAYDSTRYTPMNTWGGLMNGLPFVQNKLSFLAR